MQQHSVPGRSAGSVSIEAVLIVPLFLIVVFTIFQGSLWLHASTVAQAAAQDGVRAAVALESSAAAGQSTAQSILESRAVGHDWTVTTATDSTGATIEVTGFAMSVIPGLDLRIHESASLPWESS